MDAGKKFITVIVIMFIAGTIFGTVCGIGMGEIFGGANADVPAGSPGLISGLNDFADTAMYPNHPVALWDSGKDGYIPFEAADSLYGSRKAEMPFALKDLKSPYRIVVFESPLCPVCFAMHGWLREIRQKFTADEMEIVIINPPALSEKSAAKAVSVIREYLAASEESVKKAYITQDRLDFRHVSLRPGDQGALVKTLGITDIPFMLVLDKDLRIIYRSAGYPNGDAEEYSAFMKAPTALFNEIRGELDEMKTGDAK